MLSPLWLLMWYKYILQIKLILREIFFSFRIHLILGVVKNGNWILKHLPSVRAKNGDVYFCKYLLSSSHVQATAVDAVAGTARPVFQPLTVRTGDLGRSIPVSDW